MIGAIKGLAGIAGGLIGQKGRKAELRAAKQEYAENKQRLQGLDTSNPYMNMENTMEDLTVNTQQADFAAQQQQQGLANTMTGMRQAAGGSGIAALAQAMAGQSSANAQQASASIGQQEASNQAAERSMAGQLQSQERQGDLISRAQEKEKTETLFGMAQQRMGAAQADVNAARASIAGGIGNIVGDVATGGLGALGIAKDLGMELDADGKMVRKQD